MPFTKQRRSIYASTYSITLLLVLAHFAHNALESMHYDVLHIHYHFTVGPYAFFIKDIFPFYDAPETGFYDEVVRMDIQTYVFRVSLKLMLLAFAVDRLQLLHTLNIFLKEIPGRAFVRLPYFQIVLVCLFGYNLLDFLFFAGQTNWIYEAMATVAALLMVCVLRPEPDAEYT